MAKAHEEPTKLHTQQVEVVTRLVAIQEELICYPNLTRRASPGRSLKDQGTPG